MTTGHVPITINQGRYAISSKPPLSYLYLIIIATPSLRVNHIIRPLTLSTDHFSLKGGISGENSLLNRSHILLELLLIRETFLDILATVDYCSIVA